MRTSLWLIALAVSVGLVVTIACGNSSNAPTKPSPAPTTPTPTPSIVRIEVGGPDSVEPGASAQLTVTAIRSNGAAEDVTAQATWLSGNSSVAEISATGVVTGHARGEASITARFQSRSATRTIIVLPNGTFKLGGTVTDSGLPLEGVTIAVIQGTGEGLTATTGPTGGYALYGVAGNVRIHAKKDGYLNHIEDVAVTAHRNLDIQMALDGPRRDLTGSYVLTITGQCTPPLVRDAGNRTYRANVSQSGGRLSVELSGADFIVTNGRGNHFNGFVQSDKVIFQIGDASYYYYYYYGSGQFDIVERFPPTALVIQGSVTATNGAAGISGTLDGTIAITRTDVAPFYFFNSVCYSHQHGFDMRRQ